MEWQGEPMGNERSHPIGPAIDPETILTSIGEVVYDWDLRTDALSWSANAVRVLGVGALDEIATGSGFAALVDPASPETRHEAIVFDPRQDDGSGVPYRLRYALAQGRKAPRWFEDTGRWFAGLDGRPATAHGVLRAIPAPDAEERADLQSARLDALTGALTRTAFRRVLAEEMRRLVPRRDSAVFLMVAIEDLAQLNSDYGYDAADAVIAGVADRLRLLVRVRDRMVRHAGNKLGILLCPCDPEAMERMAVRMVAAVQSTPIATSYGQIAARIRIGGLVIPRDAREPQEVLLRAEEALTAAKSAGTGGFVAFTENVRLTSARVQNRVEADDVLRAVNERRIVVATEPVLKADRGAIAFHEALVRVRGVKGNVLGAACIVPQAERLGIIRFVDLQVLERVVAMLAADPTRSLSMNVSALTANDPEWLDAFMARVRPHPALARRLTIEITETVAVQNMATTIRLVEMIKSAGSRIAIDDFGAGHSSFRMWRSLPIDMLKIDGAFVQNLARSSDDRFFVRTLIDLARHLEVETVAEWVQDAESADMLAAWGCTYLQGVFCGHAAIEDDRALDAA